MSLVLVTTDDSGYALISGKVSGATMPASMLGEMAGQLSSGGMLIVYNGKSGSHDQKYFPPPAKPEQITGVPGLVPVKSPTDRKRWKDTDGNIYEWDYQHGTLEKYNSTGKKHLGEYDPKTGQQTKPPKPGRTTPK